MGGEVAEVSRARSAGAEVGCFVLGAVHCFPPTPHTLLLGTPGPVFLFLASGFQAQGQGKRPPPTSPPPLQRLLEVLSAESRSPDPSAGESPLGWESPALEKFHMEASARQPQTPASSPSSGSGAGLPGHALEQSSLAQELTSLEAEDPVLGPFSGMPRDRACGFSSQVGRVPSAQSSWVS